MTLFQSIITRHHFNMSNTTYSDYWLDDIEEFNSDFDDTDIKSVDFDMIKLASSRRAISNFVQILTNKTIPVYFNNKDANLTDGKVVYLSSDIIQKEDFDPAVGLALHEGSHILLSDFDILKTMWMKIPRDIYDITEPKNISKETVIDTVKFIWNIIEDRYIDNYIYRTAPGYRGYYISLYDKYFLNSKIDDMLKSKMYRKPSIDAYTNRICNFMNINTDLNALPELRTIAQIIDIKNIGRLETPLSRFELAFEVCKVIFKNVGNKEESDNLPDSKLGGGIPSDGKSENNESDESVDSEDDLGGTETGISKSESMDTPSLEKNDGDVSDLSQYKLKQIKNALEKQKNFLEGDIKKKVVSAYQKSILESIEKSGMTVEKVGYDYTTDDGMKINGAIDCIVVKNLTKELILTDEFPMSHNTYHKRPSREMINSVNRGIVMGNKLGTKLLLRNENNISKYMRKSDGKIDKRIISELGFDNDRIFCTYKSEKYNDAFIHISVDASSSMSGIKWYETMTTVTAICKACSMIENIRVSVSFRTTINSKRNNNIPYVILGYDSSRDKFSKIANLFPYLTPCGNTPEGLAFEATMNIFDEKNKESNCYFLNFSDGEPWMNFCVNNIVCSYGGENAVIHTRKHVNKIKERGYEVLSYYINETNYGSYSGLYKKNNKSTSNFQRMYGLDAVFIDTRNVNSIAKTINNMFLKKDEF